MTTREGAPGALVALEGIDGAGKTTQATLVAAKLNTLGYDVVVTKEPTDGPWGRKLRASATAGRLAPEEILRANEVFSPEPDLLVILEVPPALGVARVDARSGANLFEREEDLRRVAEVFASLRRPYLRRFDGTLPPERLADEIVRELSLRALDRATRILPP